MKNFKIVEKKSINFGIWLTSQNFSFFISFDFGENIGFAKSGNKYLEISRFFITFTFKEGIISILKRL